jgi:signal transduction histidine kinase
LEWSAPPTIAGDADKIRVVLKNILDNALKYSPPGSPPVTVALIQRPPFVMVRITDGGIGIPPEELPLLFEPFYRADKSRSKLTGGYGLGLSICKRIMDAHKGRIDIQSRPGEGTQVTLLFPTDGK